MFHKNWFLFIFYCFFCCNIKAQTGTVIIRWHLSFYFYKLRLEANQFNCHLIITVPRDFLSSCVTLLESFGISIPEQGDDERHFSIIIRMMNECLPKHKKIWLLVVDNIEESDFVTEFAPTGGHVLYTSRNRDWLKRLEIDVFKPEESVAYLLQMTGFDESHRDEAMALAIELDHLPLALAQVAAYISRQGLTSFAEYLAQYQASQAELLAKQQIQPSLNGKYGREAIVMTTWNTTMKKMPPETQNLMGHIAYLGSISIPSFLFTEIEHYDEALSQLASYSMIKHHEDLSSVHRLVQFVTRVNTQEKVGRILRFLSNSIKRNLSFQEANRDSWSKNFTLVPHADSVLEHIVLQEDIILENSMDLEKILESVSCIYEIQSNYTACKNVLERFLPIIQRIHGENSVNVETVKFYLSKTYAYLREYDKAIAIYMDIKGAQEARLSPDSMTLAVTLHNFAFLYGAIGDHENQIALFERALWIYNENVRKTNYPKNQNFIKFHTNLAHAYYAAAQYEKQKEVLDALARSEGIDKKILDDGQHFIDGAWGMYYGGVREFEKMRECFEVQLERRLAMHGEEHSLITDTLVRIGESYMNIGHYEEAEKILARALDHNRKDDARFRGVGLRILGEVYMAQHKLELALIKLNEALAYQITVLNERHPEIIHLRNRIDEVSNLIAIYPLRS